MTAPLTTIFTPPSDCFSGAPTLGENCGSQTDPGVYQPVSCYWSRPASCWPPHPQIEGASQYAQLQSITFGGDVASVLYQYSPGVLPTGFWAIGTSSITPSSSISTKIGCPVNWNTYAYEWCTTAVSGEYTFEGATHTGIYAALLPQIRVTWDVDELSLFTPRGAPNLMRTAPTRPVLGASSVAARSKYTMTESSATPSATPQTAPRTTKAPQTTQTSTPQATATQSPSSDSSNAAALGGGIGGGIGGAIVLVALLFLFWKYRQNKKKKEHRPYGEEGYEVRQHPSQYNSPNQFHSYPAHSAGNWSELGDTAPSYTTQHKYGSPAMSPVELPPQSPSEMSSTRAL